jgi:chemotaxis protein histidine kinase CheA
MVYENRDFILECYDLLKDINIFLWQSKEEERTGEAAHLAYMAAHTLHDLAAQHDLTNLNSVTSVMVAILEKLAASKLRLSDELMVILLELSKQIGTFLDHIVDEEELPELSIVYSQRLLVYLYNYQRLDLLQIDEQSTVDEWLQCDWQLKKLKSLYGFDLPPASVMNVH